MILVLSIILFLLCVLVGGSRGFKSFVVLFLDILFCLFNVILIGNDAPVILTTFLLCFLLTYIILYFVNGYNKKTIASFMSTMLILLLLLFFSYLFILLTKTQGFGVEYVEEIGWCNYTIDLNMVYVSLSSMIIGLIGSIIDTSTAVSTAVFEIYDKNPDLSFKQLFKSGYNVGKDIIATVTNTLFFAFLGSFLTLIIWFNYYNYNFALVINNKVFVAELLTILFNALGSLFIIPVTNYITCILLTKKESRIVQKIERKIIIRNED